MPETPAVNRPTIIKLPTLEYNGTRFDRSRFRPMTSSTRIVKTIAAM